MIEIDSLQSLYDFRQSLNGTLGFVPTMGALHAGHLSLVEKSLSMTDHTLVSIYVNPTQFNQSEDLDKYPRTLDRDLELLKVAGCHAVLLPSENMLYPEGLKSRTFEFGTLAQEMEGNGRPGHFEGMATVVTKFFDLVKPDFAFFGEKDYQQLCIVREVVKQENWPVEIVPCAISREDDGLAMSSRNLRLTNDQRDSAGKINQIILDHIAALGPKDNIEAWERECAAALNAIPHLDTEYVMVCDTKRLLRVQNLDSSPTARVFVAVRCGKVRLIDNFPV